MTESSVGRRVWEWLLPETAQGVALTVELLQVFGGAMALWSLVAVVRGRASGFRVVGWLAVMVFAPEVVPILLSWVGR